MKTDKPTVVLIHGLWMTPRSWEGWIDRYQKTGYTVLAPSWPGMEGEVEAIRRDTSPLKGLKMKTVVDHYERIIRKLETPPIIMGHSLGGIVVQMLVDRGLGSAAVPIAPGQPAGVPVLPFSTLRAGFSVLGNPFTFNGAPPLSPSQFHYAFTNQLDAVASKRVYDRFCIPAAARVLWDAALSVFNPYGVTRVSYRNDRAPMLFIAGTKDHVVPTRTAKATVRKYGRKSTAVTEYKEYAGRTHHLLGQDGWEEIADYALRWATEQARGMRVERTPQLASARRAG
jgi:alpha-beta hydrolase superfamily lysophospholipase